MSQTKADARLIQAVTTAHAFKPTTSSSTAATLATDPNWLLKAGTAGMSVYGGYKVATRPRDTSENIRTAKTVYGAVRDNPGLTTVAVAAVGYGLYRWWSGGEGEKKEKTGGKDGGWVMADGLVGTMTCGGWMGR